jgi:hypothetical protein
MPQQCVVCVRHVVGPAPSARREGHRAGVGREAVPPRYTRGGVGHTLSHTRDNACAHGMKTLLGVAGTPSRQGFGVATVDGQRVPCA